MSKYIWYIAFVSTSIIIICAILNFSKSEDLNVTIFRDNFGIIVTASNGVESSTYYSSLGIMPEFISIHNSYGMQYIDRFTIYNHKRKILLDDGQFYLNSYQTHEADVAKSNRFYITDSSYIRHCNNTHCIFCIDKELKFNKICNDEINLFGVNKFDMINLTIKNNLLVSLTNFGRIYNIGHNIRILSGKYENIFCTKYNLLYECNVTIYNYFDNNIMLNHWTEITNIYKTSVFEGLTYNQWLSINNNIKTLPIYNKDNLQFFISQNNDGEFQIIFMEKRNYINDKAKILFDNLII